RRARPQAALSRSYALFLGTPCHTPPRTPKKTLKANVRIKWTSLTGRIAGRRRSTMYVIARATTAAGRQLVPQLLQRGLAVRVLVRKDADAEHFAKLGADVARGDLRDV